jgi:hypothetical protein
MLMCDKYCAQVLGLTFIEVEKTMKEGKLVYFDWYGDEHRNAPGRIMKHVPT